MARSDDTDILCASGLQTTVCNSFRGSHFAPCPPHSLESLIFGGLGIDFPFAKPLVPRVCLPTIGVQAIVLIELHQILAISSSRLIITLIDNRDPCRAPRRVAVAVGYTNYAHEPCQGYSDALSPGPRGGDKLAEASSGYISTGVYIYTSLDTHVDIDWSPCILVIWISRWNSDVLGIAGCDSFPILSTS